MTKTQALQRLYKALTGNEGRNSGSKVIEDLAIAAENGEIGGGWKVATVTFVLGEGVFSAGYTAPIIREINGKQYVVAQVQGSSAVDGGTISVPVYADGAMLMVGSEGYEIELSGDITHIATEDGAWICVVTGDATITVADSK